MDVLLDMAATATHIAPNSAPSPVRRSNLGPRRLGTARLPWLAAVVAVVALAAPGLAQSLERGVRDLIDSNKLDKIALGVSIIDVESGQVLASVNDKTALIPASNHKLLTSGAALLVLGDKFEFTTRFIRDGDRLIIVGAGDPALADPDLLRDKGLSVAAFIDRLIDGLKARQVSGIKDIIFDDRVFDRQTIHPGWPQNQLDHGYCAPINGLNFHANVLNIYSTAADRAGTPPTLRSEPAAPWIEVVNAARTVATGASAVGAARDRQNPFRFRFSGELPARAVQAEPVDVTLEDGGPVLARLLADRLAQEGMAVSTAAPAVRQANPDEVLAKGPVVAEVRTSLPTILKRCNTDSHNLFAEALLKRMGFEVTGQPGSWANGGTVVRMKLVDRLGPDLGELFIADGSGLARDNRVAAGTMARWLAALGRDPVVRDAFTASLAMVDQRAGVREGTLRRRFESARRVENIVLAKSGFINGVQCLSGFVRHRDTGRLIAFSILANDISKAPGGKVREFHEEVVQLIDRHLGRPAGAAGNAGSTPASREPRGQRGG